MPGPSRLARRHDAASQVGQTIRHYRAIPCQLARSIDSNRADSVTLLAKGPWREYTLMSEVPFISHGHTATAQYKNKRHLLKGALCSCEVAARVLFRSPSEEKQKSLTRQLEITGV